MAGLFGPSDEDLERLRSAVQSLGTTSVPGLAAALSWREHKTQRVLAHELARPGTLVAYDPGRRAVRWARPLFVPPVPAPATSEPRPAERAPRLPGAPGPVLTPAGLKSLCPSCHVPLQSTGTASLAVCPSCGRLSSARIAAAGETATAPYRAPTPEPRATAPPASAIDGAAPAAALGDRRAQEMFAAWVTAQPIPCPKCRTPLRHRGVSEYTCPSCGQMVRFPTAAAVAGAASAPPPSPAA
ncbi:MAG TPA: hypothetical protein VEL82_03855 [Thermoplasmata archaeon]|nr:hypothetical protein [Thermoplasmata archaeon]